MKIRFMSAVFHGNLYIVVSVYYVGNIIDSPWEIAEEY